MFGYAIKDTPELMPLPIALAHRLARRLTEVRKSGVLDYLRPDGKTQVTVQYDGDTPVRLDTVVLSTQHADGIDLEATLTPDIREKVVNTVLNDLAHDTMDTSDYRLLVNPTGKFVLGGPMGDAGLTGRKIIVDTYGGWARHGGGAFSGKDPSKVDRSAAYAMRWVAKNVVAAGLAERVEVQVAYAIGKAAPVGLFVETFGSETVDPARIEKAITSVFDLRPGAIVRDLDLLRPIYAQTAAYGHFGRTDVELPWEQTEQGRRAEGFGLTGRDVDVRGRAHTARRCLSGCVSRGFPARCRNRRRGLRTPGRDEHLRVPGHTLNPRGLMHGHPCHVVAARLDLARVQPGAYLDSRVLIGCGRDSVHAHRTRSVRAVEGRQQSVTRALDPATAADADLDAAQVIVVGPGRRATRRRPPARRAPSSRRCR